MKSDNKLINIFNFLENSVEQFEERNKYEDDQNKNRNYDENKDENSSKENTTPENENIDIYNNSAEDTDENENNLYKVVTIYKVKNFLHTSIIIIYLCI